MAIAKEGDGQSQLLVDFDWALKFAFKIPYNQGHVRQRNE